MTGETNDGGRRVRVVPRPGPRLPHGRAPETAGPVDAETEVLPRVGPPRPERAGPPPAPGRTRHATAAVTTSTTYYDFDHGP